MTLWSCYAIGEFATGIYSQPETRAVIRDLRKQGASDATCLHTLASLAPEEWMAEAMWEEFKELPQTTVATMFDTWCQAAEAGKGWELRAEYPQSTMDFARNKQVRLVVDMSEDGVVLSISHVATRHAEWYRTAEAAIS